MLLTEQPKVDFTMIIGKIQMRTPLALVAAFLLAISLPAGSGMAQTAIETQRVTEVDAFYWTDMAPDIVNPGREEQGSFSV